ncbi:hypothetical protein M885DRAFT_542086, partial [Pelagophyceae sp. CCMP2097]
MLCNGRALGGWKPHWPEFQCPRLWKPLLDTRRVLRQLARLNFEEQRRCSLRDSEACAARDRARIAELRDIFARSLPPVRSSRSGATGGGGPGVSFRPRDRPNDYPNDRPREYPNDRPRDHPNDRPKETIQTTV